MSQKDTIIFLENKLKSLEEENIKLKTPKPFRKGSVGDILVYATNGAISIVNACGVILDNKSPLEGTINTKTGKRKVEKYGYSVGNLTDYKEVNGEIKINSIGVDYNDTIAIIKAKKILIK